MPRLAIMGFLSLPFITSCAAPEEHVIDAFLAAVRDGREEVIAGVSMVNLPDADVQSWEIVEVGPESTEPYRLGELNTAFFEAVKAYETKAEEDDRFLNDNQDNALRYQAEIRKNPDHKFTSGSMAEFQKVWEGKLEELKDLEGKLQAAEETLKRERELIFMSASIPLKDTFEGEVAVKKVKVSVNGGSGSKTYALTLRKYNIVDSETGVKPMAKWIINEIEGE